MRTDNDLIKALSDSVVNELAAFFKILGNPTRMKLLLLCSETEMCVGDLAEMLGMTQSAVSHQLQVLKSERLVKKRRNGKMILYTLADQHIHAIIESSQKHLNGKSNIRIDPGSK